MKLSLSVLALAAAATLALPAAAQTFTGDTTGAPTWNRPFEGLTGLSATGTGVRYQAIPFVVSGTGDYTFQNTAAWDNFTFIYAGSFNAATPLVNALVGNDDNPTEGLSGFTTALTAGAGYVYVTTGFDPFEFGAYSLTVGSSAGFMVPTLVPEPASVGLLGLGLAGVLLAVRRRKAA